MPGKERRGAADIQSANRALRQQQKLLQFTTDLVGTLDPVEIARTTATYARDLLRCERCSILINKRNHWSAVAISGQENIEVRSVVVKRMIAFVAANAGPATKIVSRSQIAAAAALEIDEVPASSDGEEAPLATVTESEEPGDPSSYFQDTQMACAAIVPMLDEHGEVVGALLCESIGEDFFGAAEPEALEGAPAAPASGRYRLAEWMGKHSSRAWLAASDYQSLPLLAPMRQMREIGASLGGRRRNRVLLKTGLIALIAAVICFWPAPLKVEGNCMLRPVKRAAVVPESSGRLERILVAEGEHVKQGQILAILETHRLQSELEIASQEKLRYQAETDRYRAAKDEGAAQVAFLQKQISAQKERRLQQEIALASLRSPMDGVVLTKDLDLRLGEFLQPGAPLVAVASLDQWELIIDVRESDIGLVDGLLKEGRVAPVKFIMYTRSALVLHGDVKDRRQISAIASAAQDESFFQITVPEPGLTVEMKDQLRPGLTGRAKIEVGRRPFAFVLMRKFIHWMRMRWIV